MKKLFLCILLSFFCIYVFAQSVTGATPRSTQLADKEIIRLYKTGSYKSAITNCQKLLNSHPDDNVARLFLAYSYEMLGEYKLAKSVYLQCLKDESYSQADFERIKFNLSNVYMYLIRFYSNNNNVNQAFNVVKEAEYYLPNEPRFYFSDANLNIMIENYQEAIKLIKKSWEIDPADMETKLNTCMYKLYRLGDCYKKLGKSYYNEWKKYIYSIYSANQTNDAITLLLADIYFLNDEERSKRNHLRNKVMHRYLDAHPDRPVLHIQLPVKGRWYISSGYFQNGLDTHNGYDGYCIDFVRIDENGKTRADNYKTNEDSFTFGENIYATYDGVVEIAHCVGKDNEPGVMNSETLNAVVIKHQLDDGTIFFSKYLHLKQYSSKLRVGDVIKAGDYVGQCGNSGYSTGCHLHFGIFDQNNVSMPFIFDIANADGACKEYSPKFSDIIEYESHFSESCEK